MDWKPAGTPSIAPRAMPRSKAAAARRRSIRTCPIWNGAATTGPTGRCRAMKSWCGRLQNSRSCESPQAIASFTARHHKNLASFGKRRRPPAPIAIKFSSRHGAVSHLLLRCNRLMPRRQIRCVSNQLDKIAWSRIKILVESRQFGQLTLHSMFSRANKVPVKLRAR